MQATEDSPGHARYQLLDSDSALTPSRAKLLAKDVIFRLQVCYDLLLLPVDPTSEDHDQPLELSPVHGRERSLCG